MSDAAPNVRAKRSAFSADYHRMVRPALREACHRIGYLIADQQISWSNGHTQVMAIAFRRGAGFLPDPQIAALEEWVAQRLGERIDECEKIIGQAEALIAPISAKCMQHIALVQRTFLALYPPSVGVVTLAEPPPPIIAEAEAVDSSEDSGDNHAERDVRPDPIMDGGDDFDLLLREALRQAEQAMERGV